METVHDKDDLCQVAIGIAAEKYREPVSFWLSSKKEISPIDPSYTARDLIVCRAILLDIVDAINNELGRKVH